MNLFYQRQIKPTDRTVTFDKDESRHVVKVLRKTVGDQLLITNGQGFFFTTEIVSANPKSCVVNIKGSEKAAPLPYNLHLAVAPTKLNDRYEWFLEKATEIGVSEITPIICDHSERKTIKYERYEKIVIGAMKQSMKGFLPKLNQTITLKEFVEKNLSGSQKFIAHCEISKKIDFKNIDFTKDEIIVLIGPEGDFSTNEIEIAKQNNFKEISLGNSRLRTETAAIVACHTVSLLKS